MPQSNNTNSYANGPNSNVNLTTSGYTYVNKNQLFEGSYSDSQGGGTSTLKNYN